VSPISIEKVEAQHQRRRFATFPWQIYKDDPLWVPPLLPERMKQLQKPPTEMFGDKKRIGAA
jgi:hypothetical protein